MERAGSREESAQHTKGKQFMLFLMCAGVAAMLWLFTTLSGLFEYSVKVRLAYNLPEDQTTTRQLPDEATMLVQTTGWQLIREEFNNRSLSLNISNIDANDELITNQQIELFIADMPSDIHVLHVYPDTISLHLEPRSSKKIPVELYATLNSPGVLTDSLELVPDSVTISGPQSMISRINHWTTEGVITYLDTITAGIIPLAEPSDPEIELSAVACRYMVKLDFEHKMSLSGTLYCPTANTSISVLIITSVPYARRNEISFADYTLQCTHVPEAPLEHAITCIESPPHTYNNVVIIPLISQE